METREIINSSAELELALDSLKINYERFDGQPEDMVGYKSRTRNTYHVKYKEVGSRTRTVKLYSDKYYNIDGEFQIEEIRFEQNRDMSALMNISINYYNL